MAEHKTLTLKSFNSFHKGMLLGVGPEVHNPEYPQVIENADISAPGRLRNATGFEQIGDTIASYPPDGLGFYQKAGDDSHLIVVWGGTVYRLNSKMSAFSTIKDISFAKGTRVEIVQAANKLIVSNGLANVFSIEGREPYDSDSEDNVSFSYGYTVTEHNTRKTDPPKFRTALWINGFLLVADVPGSENLVYASNPGEPLIFDKTGTTPDYKSIGPDGFPVKKISSLGDTAAIFYKTRGIYKMAFTQSLFSNMPIRKVNSQMQLASSDSVIDTGDDNYFITRYGIHSLNRTDFDNIRSGLIGDPEIQDIFRGVGDYRFREDLIDKCCAGLYGDYAYFAIPADTLDEKNPTTANLILKYHLSRKSWQIDSRYYPNQFIEIFYNNKSYFTFSDGRATTGKVNAFNSKIFSYGGSNVPFRYISPPWDAGKPYVDKEFDTLAVRFKDTGDVDVSVYARIDGGAWQDVGTMNLAGVGNQFSTTFFANSSEYTLVNRNLVSNDSDCFFALDLATLAKGRGRIIEIKFEHSGTDEQIEILAIDIFDKTYNVRRKA